MSFPTWRGEIIMKNFIKHYIWFLKSSCNFLDNNIFGVIKKGGLKKAYTESKFMCKWDKMTSQQREYWYINERYEGI